MKALRYPRGGLLADGARAGFGLLLTAPPLLAVDMLWPVALIFAALALTFAWFGARTLCRARSVYRFDETRLEAAGCHRARIEWAALDRLKLRHFRPRRKPAEGWIEMRLRAGRERLLIESRLDGFEEIARTAVQAARGRGLTLDARTQDALISLGLTQDLKSDPGRWDWPSITPPQA